jgi:Protein of unknown function (DUF669)
MRYDFSSVDDVESFVSVPEGLYRCRIAEVRERPARDGSVRWSFRLEVLDGEWAGRTAAWDSVTWSERGIFRVKKVLEALNLDVSGELELEPGDLVNLQALVKVVPEDREDPTTGRRQIRNRVPYLGYAHVDAESVAEGDRGAGSPPDRDGAQRRRRGDPEAVAPVDGWGGGGE